MVTGVCVTLVHVPGRHCMELAEVGLRCLVELVFEMSLMPCQSPVSDGQGKRIRLEEFVSDREMIYGVDRCLVKLAARSASLGEFQTRALSQPNEIEI